MTHKGLYVQARKARRNGYRYAFTSWGMGATHWGETGAFSSVFKIEIASGGPATSPTLWLPGIPECSAHRFCRTG
jgi:hypothetical protein